MKIDTKKLKTNNKKVLFFDLDDTLIKCSGYYYLIEDIVASKIEEYSNMYSHEELRYMFNVRQAENIEEHGYGPENFRISLMQISSEVLGYSFFKDKLWEFIEKETQILFELPIELIDGVEETIKHLYDNGYSMSVITKGHKEVQKNRFESLSIKDYFRGYEIVKHKAKRDYEDILNKYKLNPLDCYMIGNSPKGDINEAKLAGLNTIYIPNHDTWAYEDEKILDCKPETKVLSDIREMIKITL